MRDFPVEAGRLIQVPDDGDRIVSGEKNENRRGDARQLVYRIGQSVVLLRSFVTSERRNRGLERLEIPGCESSVNSRAVLRTQHGLVAPYEEILQLPAEQRPEDECRS